MRFIERLPTRYNACIAGARFLLFIRLPCRQPLGRLHFTATHTIHSRGCSKPLARTIVRVPVTQSRHRKQSCTASITASRTLRRSA